MNIYLITAEFAINKYVISSRWGEVELRHVLKACVLEHYDNKYYEFNANIEDEDSITLSRSVINAFTNKHDISVKYNLNLPFNKQKEEVFKFLIKILK